MHYEECLKVLVIFNMLYGLQGLHLDAPEVSSLVYALLPYIKSSMEALHSQHVSNALYGISGLFDESVPSTVSSLTSIELLLWIVIKVYVYTVSIITISGRVHIKLFAH